MTESNRQFTVSVVIPAYNAGKYIKRAIDSVLAQSRPPDEIIVVDDGSTDETAEIVQSYGAKVTYIHQENGGASTARNAGINAAKGEWIAFLDGDDEWLTEHLRLQTELLARNPELIWSTGNFERCLCRENRRGVHIQPDKAQYFLKGKDYLDDYFAGYTASVRGCTDTMIIKRSALLEAGGFRVGQAKANDLDMWWRLAYRWPKIGYVGQASAVYHMDVDESITHGHFGADIYCDLIERHLKLSAEMGRQDRFRVFASVLLRRWMRSMLFDNRSGDIRRMMERFDELLPGYYKSVMRLLTTFGGVTAGGCHVISRIVRLLNLRKQITRRPSKK